MSTNVELTDYTPLRGDYIILHDHVCPRCFAIEQIDCPEWSSSLDKDDCDGFRFCAECTTLFCIGYQQSKMKDKEIVE